VPAVEDQGLGVLPGVELGQVGSLVAVVGFLLHRLEVLADSLRRPDGLEGFHGVLARLGEIAGGVLRPGQGQLHLQLLELLVVLGSPSFQIRHLLTQVGTGRGAAHEGQERNETEETLHVGAFGFVGVIRWEERNKETLPLAFPIPSLRPWYSSAIRHSAFARVWSPSALSGVVQTSLSVSAALPTGITEAGPKAVLSSVGRTSPCVLARHLGASLFQTGPAPHTVHQLDAVVTVRASDHLSGRNVLVCPVVQGLDAAAHESALRHLVVSDLGHGSCSGEVSTSPPGMILGRLVGPASHLSSPRFRWKA
jgi:hypothetical protein